MWQCFKCIKVNVGPGSKVWSLESFQRQIIGERITMTFPNFVGVPLSSRSMMGNTGIGVDIIHNSTYVSTHGGQTCELCWRSSKTQQ